jgi:hypothetical protein
LDRHFVSFRNDRPGSPVPQNHVSPFERGALNQLLQPLTKRAKLSEDVHFREFEGTLTRSLLRLLFRRVVAVQVVLKADSGVRGITDISS